MIATIVRGHILSQFQNNAAVQVLGYQVSTDQNSTCLTEQNGSS